MPKKKKRSVRTASTAVPTSDFYNGTNVFALPNGDTYVGDYCAHRSGLIWREGHGFYQTEDGHVYDGQWKDDKLIDNCDVAINYPNGDSYEGNLTKNKYQKSGVVSFDKGPYLYANFENNKPAGEVHLADSEGKLWRGTTSAEIPDMVYCRPENVFFNQIHPERGVRKGLLKDIEPTWTESISAELKSFGEEGSSLDSAALSERSLEKREVFSKKPRIKFNIDWEDSSWYQNFAKYREQRDRVLGKVNRHEHMNNEENKWYRQYSIWKRHRNSVDKDIDKKDTEVDTSLLDQFYSEEHRERNKGYSTFLPTYYWKRREVEEEESIEESSVLEESQVLEEQEEEKMCAEDIISEEEGEEEEEKIGFKENVRSTACGTGSLYDFVRITVGRGRIIKQDCDSVF